MPDRHDYDRPPLLGQVPARELQRMIRGPSKGQGVRVAETRRRRPFRRLLPLVYLGLGVVTVAGLGRGTFASLEDGLSRADVARLLVMAIATITVVVQAVAVLRVLPGGRTVWRATMRLRARIRASRPRQQTGPMPLLAQAPVAGLAGLVSKDVGRASAVRWARGRLAGGGRTLGWVLTTLVIIALAGSAAAYLVVALVRSVGDSGWSGALLWEAGLALVVGYGVGSMSVRLVRSWFERRRRKGRRMLLRLVRYLLRLFSGGPTRMARGMRGLGARLRVPGRLAVTASSSLVVLAAAFAPGLAPRVAGAGPSPDQVAVSETIPAPGHPQQPVAMADFPPLDPLDPATTTAPEQTTTGSPSTSPPTSSSLPATTTSVGGTSSTSVPTTSSTTTPTTSSTTTTTPTTSSTTASTTSSTTTTTTTLADTSGPVVSGVSDAPDPIYTSGGPTDTSSISATVTDSSGVASVIVYYRTAKNAFAVWGAMKAAGGGVFVVGFGPFITAGVYDYRIVATDVHGNANCSIGKADACPGGTVTVIIP